ncbi:MAG: antitoxin [Deltaproteobacteria bacterium]|nr:antitoxin [Deltaproteobacteria bacterium]
MCYTIAEALSMPSEQKIKQNLRAVENAIAQQRLEGLEVPPDIIAEMQRAARGEIEIEEGIRDTIRKFASGFLLS